MVDPLPRALFDALVARARRTSARQDARAAKLRTAVATCLARLRERGTVREAWLIGSIVWGGFGEHSDVDVVVRSDRPEDVTEVWAELSKCVGDHLDVLRLDALPRSFQQRVVEEGVPL